MSIPIAGTAPPGLLFGANSRVYRVPTGGPIAFEYRDHAPARPVLRRP